MCETSSHRPVGGRSRYVVDARLVQRIGPELHAVRCFSVELQAFSASANVVKGEPAILIAL